MYTNTREKGRGQFFKNRMYYIEESRGKVQNNDETWISALEVLGPGPYIQPYRSKDDLKYELQYRLNSGLSLSFRGAYKALGLTGEEAYKLFPELKESYE